MRRQCMHWYGRGYGTEATVVVGNVTKKGVHKAYGSKARQGNTNVVLSEPCFCRGEDERLQMTAVVGATLR